MKPLVVMAACRIAADPTGKHNLTELTNRRTLKPQPMTRSTKLVKFKKLFDTGVITQAKFHREKPKILSQA